LKLTSINVGEAQNLPDVEKRQRISSIIKKMKNKKPEIRFKGFNEEWEEKKLEDGTSKIGDGLHGTPQYVNEQSKNDKILNTNTILMSINGTIGNLAWYQGEKVMLGKSVAYITLEDFDKTFIYAYLQTSFIQNYFMNKLTGSTIKNLGLKTIRETEILIPTNKTEQTQIGNFFKNLDSLITLHQRKYEKLGILKKAMLEKMFPKNGKNVPEIRFKGFEVAWEERTLSCIVSRVSCISNKVGLPRVEYEDIVSGKGELNKNIEQKNSRKIGIEFEIGDVLYGKLRPYLNNWLLPTFQGIAVGDFWVFRPNETSSKFIFYLIQTSDYEKIANQSSGSKMPRADWNLMSNAVFFIPLNKEEQEKIGNYFKNLDNLLTLHQGELGKLKNLKKAMLEKMFV
jgi:type I restriction enzyme, S subunit